MLDFASLCELIFNEYSFDVFFLLFQFLLRDILQFDKSVNESQLRLTSIDRTCNLLFGVGDGKVIYRIPHTTKYIGHKRACNISKPELTKQFGSLFLKNNVTLSLT